MKKSMEYRIEKFDNKLFKFLKKYNSIMPKRLCKLIAYFYTDARIRKIYWEKLNVHMGDGTFANIGMIAVNSEKTPIYIGKNVSIAPYVILVAESEANNGEKINNIPYVNDTLRMHSSIVIDDDVWIGANVTILPGVHIGKCSVIGAGSVVINDIESYSIYAGVPAKKIRDLKGAVDEQ